MIIQTPQILDLPKIVDPRGNLSIIEQIKQIPFEIKRVHWIYDVPGGLDRGGHAYKQTEEFIVALSGSFEMEKKNKFFRSIVLITVYMFPMACGAQ